jgi:DNA-binding transcriptional regulator YiaG
VTPGAIRSARRRVGMSHREFAEALGFAGKQSHITVWRWESGKRMPSPQTITLIKQLLRAHE